MINLTATSPFRHLVVAVFFALVLLLGLFIYRHYGFSMDEAISHTNGMISLKYVGQKLYPAWVAADPEFDRYPIPLAEYNDRDYGVAFEAPVAFLERLCHFNDPRQQFLLRHLCTFLVCFTGVIAVYQLAARRFQDWRWGLLAAVWLLLSPRLFAESFYNDKDAVFMAVFAIATNTAVRFLLRPTLSRIVWHALACAIAIDVRIMGILVPAATIAMLGWQGIRKTIPWSRLLAVTAAYGSLLVVLVVAFWPYLWSSPLKNFVEAYQNMSLFRWSGNVLYQGEMISALHLPWHYIPVWISITTPILYLAAAVLGISLVIYTIIQQRWRLWSDNQQMQDVLFLGLFLGPLTIVVVLHSVLYDGWRQLYFIYPSFLLLAMRGWVAAVRWRAHRRSWVVGLRVVLILSLGLTAAQMVRDHPLQNVYFNLLAGSNVGQRFELDYWGVGYQQSLAYIVTHDSRPIIRVHAPAPSPVAGAHMMLGYEQRDRLKIVDNLDQADYFITDYRGHPEPYTYPEEVYQIWVDGRRVHSVFKLR